MHSAWHIEEINLLIFEHLERRDRARLARTSQNFHSVAIDGVWETLDSFEALVRLLPSDFLDRPLQRGDLERLDFYVSKVRHLRLETDLKTARIQIPQAFMKGKRTGKTGEIIKEKWKALWEQIAEVRPPSQLFRNLRSLYINNVVEAALVPLIGISGSHLTTISIKFVECIERESVIRSILDGLHDTPNLQYLFVRDGETGLVPERLILYSPLEHLRLNARKFPKTNPAALRRLHEAPKLQHHVLQKSTIQHLSIALDNNWLTPEIEALEGRHLPALKSLWLNLRPFKPVRRCESCPPGNDLRWGCNCRLGDGNKTLPGAFFDRLDNPELSLLNIRFPAEANGRMVLDIVSAVDRGCRVRNLTELRLVDTTAPYGGYHVKPLELRAALQTLLPLPRLKILYLYVAAQFHDVLDLQLYKSIADGLPALETLHLGNRNTCGHTVSLTHLAAFCQMLPRLVKVSVWAAELDPPGTTPRLQFVCPSVKSFQTRSLTAWRNVIEGTYYWPHKEHLRLSAEIYFPNSHAPYELVDE